MFVDLSQTGLVCSSLLKGNELNRYRDVKDITTSLIAEGWVLLNDALNTFTVIWRHTYGKGPFR